MDTLKILLRGDTIGVPDRLNTIVEIILRVVLDNEGVEEAIKKVQKPIVARWRLKKELPKIAIRVDVNSKPFRVVCKNEFKKFNWLNLRLKDLYKVCNQLNYLVVSERLMKGIKEDKWDENKKRYIVKTYKQL